MFKNNIINLTKILAQRHIYNKIIIITLNKKDFIMSLNGLFENEISEQKNDNIISELNISENKNYSPIKTFKEDFKDCNSSNSISNISSIIKNQFIKEMTNKNIISDDINSEDEYFENKPIDSQNINTLNFKNFENLENFSEKNAYDSQKIYVDLENSNFNHEISFNFNSNSSYSILIDDNINNNENINDIPYDVNNSNIYEKNIYNNNNSEQKKKYLKW